MRPLLLRIARWLFWMTVDEALKQALPKIYERIDAELPTLLTHKGTPTQVNGVIASAISDAIGRRASLEQIRTVILLYNPVVAALRNVQS